MMILEIHQIRKLAYPRMNLSRHPVMRQIQLLQAVHISNTIRNTPFKLIVRNNDHRNGRIPNVFRTKSGNFPTNLLLLRSSSNKSFKFTKLCGIVPQNLFEFT